MTARARDPVLFPAHVSQYSLELDREREYAFFPAPMLPPALHSAVPKRQHEFLAGRYCAGQALRSIAPALATYPIGIGSHREPLWPPGIVGSITHANGSVSVAVSRARDASGIGLDIEPLMDVETATCVQGTIATTEELEALASQTGWPMPLLVTLVFSAKESTFKCLYPRVGRYFDFLDASVTAIDRTHNRLTVCLRTSLAHDLRAGLEIDARFECGASTVATGMLIPPMADTR